MKTPLDFKTYNIQELKLRLGRCQRALGNGPELRNQELREAILAHVEELKGLLEKAKSD